jgi:hypothetical protein
VIAAEEKSLLITCHYYVVHSALLLNIGVHEIAYDVVSPQIGRTVALDAKE